MIHNAKIKGACEIIAALCLLFSSSILWATESSHDTKNLIPEFQNVFGRIAKDEDGALPDYEKLQSIYAQMGGSQQKQTAQLMSMTDAMFGRYQDAGEHYYTTFPTGRNPLSCPTSGFTPEPALKGLRRLAIDAHVVLINESHSMVITRAFIYQLLPALHSLGFKYLALEALAPASDVMAKNQSAKVLKDAALQSRGYPLDQSSAGFYLREPIYAELVREAVAEGFTLIAYETLQAKSRDEREEGQTSALARLVASDPEAKVVVIAGYSHIWKTDGWMADRLQKQISGKILSIDQTSGIFGCEAPLATNSLKPYILTDARGHGWASMPGRVDVTVLHPKRKDGRAAPSGWLTLDGRRKGIRPNTADCISAWPCLVSAIYAKEDENAVPADRVLLEGSNDKSLLFLKPGNYRYEVEPRGHPKITRELMVH